MKVTLDEIRENDSTPYIGRKVLAVESISACKALTGLSDGEIRLVPGYGFYRYDATSTLGADDLIVLLPNTLAGRFINDLWFGITYRL